MIALPGMTQAATKLVVSAPLLWRSTARRRRFLFLGASAPGYLTLALLPLHRSLALVLAGLMSMALAWSVRVLSEPQLNKERLR